MTTKEKSHVPASRPYTLDPEVLHRIWMERLRQKHLLKMGKITFSCDSPIVDNDRKLRALVEEIGEVAQALEAFEHHGCSSSADGLQRFRDKKAHLKTELTQVAAVAVAWLEALDKEGV